MLTGFDGVRYGLVVPKKESKPAPKKGLSVFGDEDSEDEKAAVGRNIERQAQKKLSDQKVAKLQAAALSEDPSIFDYDSHFDTMQDQREASKPVAQARKSRYIETLLDKNKERQREQDIIYERKLLRERKAEDHLFGDKDKFVTSAYKKKLEEDKKWLEEEAIREKKEAQDDVRKRGHMGDFYRNLLSRNVAFGTAQPEAAATKSEAKQEASDLSHADHAQGREADASKAAQPNDPKWEEMRRAREAYEARQAQNSAEDSAHPQPILDPRPNREQDIAAAEQLSSKSTDVALQPIPEAEKAEVVLSKEDKAAAARERFLARKRKTPG